MVLKPDWGDDFFKIVRLSLEGGNIKDKKDLKTIRHWILAYFCSTINA